MLELLVFVIVAGWTDGVVVLLSNVFFLRVNPFIP